LIDLLLIGICLKRRKRNFQNVERPIVDQDHQKKVLIWTVGSITFPVACCILIQSEPRHGQWSGHGRSWWVREVLHVEDHQVRCVSDLVWVPYNKVLYIGWLINNRELFLTALENKSLKSGSGEDSLPGCRLLMSPCIFTW
jgi:hypothetical protein